MMDKQELLSVLGERIVKEDKEITDVSDWINGYYCGRFDALTFAYERVKWIDEPEKPEIPKFVADWIEEVKQRGCGLADALNCFESPIMPEKVKQWIQFDFAAIGCHHDNQELLAKAWLNGYTIEKAPVWIVKAPYDRYFGGFLEKGQHAEINFSHINRDNAQKFEDKSKAVAVATLVDGTVEEWSE